MANGDCAVGATNKAHIEELTRRMTALETTVEKTCKSVQDHLTESRVEKAGLTRGDKLQLAALQFIGPILLAVLAWYLRASA
jgi:phage host-nuclease inhibitor protein Gam